MKKQHVDHVLRTAGRITGEKQFIILGSQALHGRYPDLADSIVRSVEVDLFAKQNPSRTEWLNVIGQDSKFHEQFGYYADPVDEKTAILPKGWKGRLVSLPAGDTEGVRGLCLEPHDLAIAKYVACREKDVIFNRELVSRRLVFLDRLLNLLDDTSISQEARQRIRAQIAHDFGAQRDQHAMPGAGSQSLEQIRAEARQDWLKLRNTQTKESSRPELDRSPRRRGKHLPVDLGREIDDDEVE